MSEKKAEEFDSATAMCEMFDCMSEENQKRFCEGILQKKSFFEDAYKNMMDTFKNAMKNEKEKENNNIVGSDGM